MAGGRIYSPRLIGATVIRLVRPVLGRRGFTEAAVITHWEEIVGSQLAVWTSPVKVAFPRGESTNGTLHLRVAGGAIATEIQHRQKVLLERINGYFGFGAITRLKLVQGTLPQKVRPSPKPLPPLPPDREAALADLVVVVEDEPLRESLRRLGQAVLSRG